MKKGAIGLLVIALTLGSCQKDVFDPNYNPDLGVRVPENFEWSTTRTLTVNVDVNDEYNGKYYYAVRVYDKTPAEGVLPVAASGKVNGEMPFSQKIVVPATVSKLYIHQVFKKADASEVIVRKEVAIDGEAVACSFGNGGGTRSASTRDNDKESTELKDGITINKKGNYHINGSYTIGEIDDNLKDVNITVNPGGTLNCSKTTGLFQWKINIKHGGNMTATEGTMLSMKNSSLINYGTVNIYDIEFDNGSIFQNGNAMTGENEGACFFAHNITLVNGNGNGSDKRDLGERSYTSCEKLILDKNKLSFKTSALLKCNVLSANGGACTLLGDEEATLIGDTGYAGLAKIGTITGGLKIENDILVECKNTTIKQENVVSDASGMITIIGTTCNEGGFGNNEKAKLGEYTYIIEDMYPTQGDYDMNDIVVTLIAEQDDDEIEIDWTLKAVGATFPMIPYIKVNGETRPLKAENGIALSAHAILSGGQVTSTPINTISGQVKYQAQSDEIEFDDVKAKLNMDDIDFYIVVNDKEIHWNTKSDDGRSAWGMRIPGAGFKWPQEEANITKTYPEFQKWFEDKSYPWYKKYDASLVYTAQ